MVATQAARLRSAEASPLVVDLGFGASPVTTVELYERLRGVRPDVEVIGLEIDPLRVEEANNFMSEGHRERHHPGLTFALGGFELAVPRLPTLVRAFNVLRQYEEGEARSAWDRLCAGLAPDGVLVEGTCDEIGRRAVWVTLKRTSRCHTPRPGRQGPAAWSGCAEPLTVTFAARVASLSRPSELAERLPKALIHHNVPGESIHNFLDDFDRAWAAAAPRSVFGPRQRWVAAVEDLSHDWPVSARPPLGGRARWRLGELTLPWEAVAPDAATGRDL